MSRYSVFPVAKRKNSVYSKCWLFASLRDIEQHTFEGNSIRALSFLCKTVPIHVLSKLFPHAIPCWNATGWHSVEVVLFSLWSEPRDWVGQDPLPPCASFHWRWKLLSCYGWVSSFSFIRLHPTCLVHYTHRAQDNAHTQNSHWYRWMNISWKQVYS